MNALLTLLHIVLAVFVLRRSGIWSNFGRERWIIPALLAFKVVTGYMLARYYEKTYGGGDMQGYLADTESMYQIFRECPSCFFRIIFGMYSGDEKSESLLGILKLWNDSGFNSHYNDARSVIRFHSLIRLFSGGNEWIHLLWSGVFALSGSVMLLKVLFSVSPTGTDRELPVQAWLLMFLPNVMLWSSSVLKEPFLLFFMGGVIWSMHRWITAGGVKYVFCLAVYIALFLLVKSFWLLILIPGLLIWRLKPEMKKPLLTVGLVYVAVLVFVLAAGSIFQEYHLPSLLYGQQLNMWRFGVFMHAGSLVHPVAFAPTSVSLLRHLPDALIYGLFQPYPWNVKGLSYIPMLIENAIILFILVRSVQLLLSGNFRLRGTMPAIAIFTAMAVIVISAFTTPVIGSLVRYRMPGVLLLLGALISSWPDKKQEF